MPEIASLEPGTYRVELEFMPRLPVEHRQTAFDEFLTALPAGSQAVEMLADTSFPWLRVTVMIRAGSATDALVAVGRALDHVAIYVRQQTGRNPLQEQGWPLRVVFSPGHLAKSAG